MKISFPFTIRTFQMEVYILIYKICCVFVVYEKIMSVKLYCLLFCTVLYCFDVLLEPLKTAFSCLHILRKRYKSHMIFSIAYITGF